MYNICFAYWKAGEHEKALEQAEKLPNLYKARENALVYFLSGEERKTTAREALTPIAWVIAHHLEALCEEENNPAYLSKAAQIIDILFDGEEKNEFVNTLLKKLSNQKT